MGISADASCNVSQGGENIGTQILTKLTTPDFLYGAATGAGLVLIIVIIVYIIYCCVKKRKEKKTPTSTADLGYGLTERVTPEDHAKAEEATQPLCVNDTESNSNDNLDDYLTPVEVQVRTQPSNQSPHEQEANGNGKNEPVYASPITKETSPPSNSTVVKSNTVDTEGDNNGDDNDNEDSTPFDKGCVPTPHNSDRKRYQSLKRIYENCTKPRHYMNLKLLKSKTDHQNGAQAESSNTSAARRTSPAYVNVPKKQP